MKDENVMKVSPAVCLRLERGYHAGSKEVKIMQEFSRKLRD